VTQVPLVQLLLEARTEASGLDTDTIPTVPGRQRARSCAGRVRPPCSCTFFPLLHTVRCDAPYRQQGHSTLFGGQTACLGGYTAQGAQPNLHCTRVLLPSQARRSARTGLPSKS